MDEKIQVTVRDSVTESTIKLNVGSNDPIIGSLSAAIPWSNVLRPFSVYFGDQLIQSGNMYDTFSDWGIEVVTNVTDIVVSPRHNVTDTCSRRQSQDGARLATTPSPELWFQGHFDSFNKAEPNQVGAFIECRRFIVSFNDD